MAAECEPLSWKTKFCWQRGVKAAKEALVVLTIDAMVGVGLVEVLIISSQDRPGESSFLPPCAVEVTVHPLGPEHPAAERALLLQMGH